MTDTWSLARLTRAFNASFKAEREHLTPEAQDIGASVSNFLNALSGAGAWAPRMRADALEAIDAIREYAAYPSTAMAIVAAERREIWR